MVPSTRAFGALVLLAALACEQPEHVSLIEPRAIVTGSVLVATPTTSAGCVVADAVGPVMLFLFSADDPPPPEGTGSPVSFSLVTREALLGGGELTSTQLLRAEYTFSNVEPGAYIVTGFMDVDEDFNPLISSLAQPTAGDVVGGYVDAEGEFAVLSIEDNLVYEQVNLQIGIPLPLERPAFDFAELTPELDGSLSLDLTTAVLPTIGAAAECSGFLVAPSAFSPLGDPVDEDGDGELDVYPQVLLSKLEPEEDGAQLVVLGAVRTGTVARLLEASPSGVVLQALETKFQRFSVLIREGEAPEIQQGIPAGSYAVSVISGTGQTWTVPNALPDLFGSVAPAQGVPLILTEAF